MSTHLQWVPWQGTQFSPARLKNLPCHVKVSALPHQEDSSGHFIWTSWTLLRLQGSDFFSTFPWLFYTWNFIALAGDFPRSELMRFISMHQKVEISKATQSSSVSRRKGMCAYVLSRFCHAWVFVTPWLQPTRLLCPWILQARILEWIIMPSCRGSSWPRVRTWVSYVSCIGRWVLYH